MNERPPINQASEQAAAYVAEIGGMPEIERASADLRVAIDQTGQEIADATIASRFLRNPSDNFLSMLQLEHVTPRALQAIEFEGEAGYKRVQLATDLESVEGALFILLHRLVAIRADLKFAETEE